MSSSVLSKIRETVLREKVVPIEFDFGYRVIFSTLQGNMPINDRIRGNILDVPVDLKLEYSIIPNTFGSYPVNTRLRGVIGDTPILGRMMYKIVYSTIAGNFPVNTGIELKTGDKRYHLKMPITMALGAARGGGLGGGAVRKKRVFAPKFIRGKMLIRDEVSTGGGGMLSEAGRPIVAGIRGVMEDVEIDLEFSFTYYCNTSSGRNPINNRIHGFLRAAGTNAE